VDTAELSSALAALRTAFDDAFADAPRPPGAAPVPLLGLQVGATAAAVRVHATGGLHRLGRVVAVPSRAPALLGVTGLRGAAVPVFSLAALLGVAPAAAPAAWMLLAPGEPRVGLAFDALLGHALAAPAALRPAEGGGRVRELFDDGARRWPVLDLDALVRDVRSPLESPA
jgi:purine-binding chemotaxis protein CheW